MLNLPIYVSALFGFATLLVVALFYVAAGYSKRTLMVLAAWLTLQAVVSLSGFYTRTDVMPPRCILLFWPPVLGIVALFCFRAGRRYLDGLDLRMLTLLHSVRILTALIFFWLFIGKAVPRLLTWEGRNFDFLVGLTAPAAWYFGAIKKSLSPRVLWSWNLLGLAFLTNLVVNAILSGPFPFQQFGFDQPDIAFLYFPFTWMSCCVVPLLLLSHLAAMRQLMLQQTIKKPV